MDMQSYEEVRIPRDDSWTKYLKEGMDVTILLWNGKVRWE
jgi:translation elongation factor P/translation initiation factor 5A